MSHEQARNDRQTHRSNMRRANQQLHDSKSHDYSDIKQRQFEGEMSLELARKEEGDKKR